VSLHHLCPDTRDALDRVEAWEGGHFLTGLEPGLDGTRALLDLAAAVRRERDDLARQRPLAGRTFAGMFFDPSLRTRTSMDVACAVLGAHCVDLQPGSGMWTLEFSDQVVMDGLAQEHVKEAAGVLGRYAQVLGLRAFPTRGRWGEERTQPIHAAFARYAGVPVVNLEGPFAHPCQGLADALTLRDVLGQPKGRRFVLSWAPHPRQLPLAVPHSAMWAAAAMGMDVVVARPDGFDLDDEAMASARTLAASAGGSISVTDDRDDAFRGASVVYAKAWGATTGIEASPGGHADAIASLRHWTVKPQDMERGNDAKFMHCLPVRRNVVVADAVLDGPWSVVLDQAANRQWAQAALLLALMGR
jgi:N-acetylornithine carbamoyltransferase